MSSSPSKQVAPAARKSRGRQKVSMVKMSNHSNLQVTFSKRRAGLFKKASELCTLCAAEAAIVVFSPANKVYCFGHPNVQTVVDRLAPQGATVADQTNPRSRLILEAHRNSSIRELNIELTRVESLLRAEKQRAEEIEGLRKAGRAQRWLPASMDDLDFAQLAALKESVEEFKRSLDAKLVQNQNQNQMMMAQAQAQAQAQQNQVIPTSSFSFGGGLSSDFLPYFNVDQSRLNDLVGGVTTEYYPTTNTSSSSHDYLRENIYGSNSGAMLTFNVVNGASNSSIGSGEIGFAQGLGHAHGLFHQMY